MDLMMTLPILRSRPALVSGMPVSRAIFCFAWVIPNALFQENATPGIFIIFPINSLYSLKYSVRKYDAKVMRNSDATKLFAKILQ